MIVTSIMPCIKVTKESDSAGVDMYIDEGTNIKIIDESGKEINGKFLYLELSQYVEQDDILHIRTLDGETTSIGISHILDIEEIG